MQKKSKQSINKKKELISVYNVALKTFAMYGYKKTTVEDIAGELGMTKGSLYLYAKNKQDLYEKTLNYALSMFLDVMSSSVREEDHALRQITRLTETGVNYMFKNVDTRALLVDLPNVVTDPETYNERFGDIIEKSVNIISGVLEKGVQEKLFRNFDVDYVAELLFHFYSFFIMNSVILNNVLSVGESTAKMYTEIVNLVLFGIVRNSDGEIPEYPGFENWILSAR